ncbi:g11342 [Coccomyxa elongata]
MGKIKNLEAKKKAAHVFTSGGGGGGTKGPAILDKRNVEQDCPYCDRTFKQVQRLREHVQKKHPDEDVEEGRSEQQPDTFASKPGPGAGPKQGKMMDVGAKAGYYTQKSPKMMLLEWCQQQKRPMPRYRSTTAEVEAAAKCKVVLADPKDRNKDIVVFLAAEHQADTPEEAEQRAAVTALHRVAGDRALHRVLPEAYLPLWQEQCAKAELRAEREARSAAAAEARSVREKSRRQALARGMPKDVIMSDKQRRMVEGILRGLSADPALAINGAADEQGLAAEYAGKLSALGFASADVADALAVAIAQDGRPSLETALDWLCVNVPEEDLPAVFAAGASGKPAGVLHSAHSAASGVAAATFSAASAALSDLTDMGYAIDEAAAALQNSSGDAVLAHEHMFDRLTGNAQEYSGGDASVADTEAWDEERVALEAIYDGDVTFPSKQQTVLHVDAHGQRLTLDFRIRPGGTYPDDPPIIGIRSAELAPVVRLELTRRLHAVGEGMRGEPMLYELASAAPGLLEDTLRSPAASARLRPAMPAAAHSPEAEPKSTAADVQSIAAPLANGASQHTSHRRQPTIDEPAESRRLKAQREKWLLGAKMQAMRSVREKLPAHLKRQQVLDSLQEHRVVIISGATGCGKSTQLPQYILEQAVEEGWGGACNIVVTQPRRISAVGVATRVAAERGEPLGDVVGYSVRLDSRTSRRTRLLFCTTGVLLRRLLGDPALQGTTHVVVDEVHERSADSDLLLLLLRGLLASCANPKLRVVLMSATAEAGLFQTYFDAELAKGRSTCSLVTIPGFTHPVQDFFLEDVLERTNFIIGRGSKWAKKGKPEASASKTAAGNGASSAALASRRAPAAWDDDDQERPLPQHAHGRNGSALLAGEGSTPQYSAATLRSLATVDESLINYELLESLVCHVVSTQQLDSDANAILIFLPGAPEISRLVRALQGSSRLKQAASGQALRILPLHGSLPPEQQSRVFQKVGPGTRKIVVATNVAETSITIDDVVCVIDCGRVKEIRYDAERSISRLQEMWESAASAQQRRGRAGRVRPGTCFRLFSRKQAATFQAQQLPEVLRMPLESLCLSVKAALRSAQRLQYTLGRLISPPQPDAIAAAVTALTNLGALDDSEELTALGRHLTLMPMDARLAKTLIYAVILRCVGPVLTVVAAMGYGRPAFQSPPDRREEAELAKRQLTADSAAARSDHLALVAAFSGWNQARIKDGRQAAYQWAAQNSVSDAAMEAALQGRAEYAGILADLGFLHAGYAGACSNGTQGPSEEEYAHYDEYSCNARVIKAAICAGFYPNILRVDHPPAVFKHVLGGAMEHEASPVRIKFFDRVKGRVFIHPASVNFNCGSFPSGWLLYTDVTETSKVFVREASMVPVYALLLFGGALTVHHSEGLIRLDGWATFKAPAQIAALVNGLRREIDQLLLMKIEEPSFDLSASKVVEAVLKLLVHDGF